MTEMLEGTRAPSDPELISRVRAGDLDAYGQLFSRHADAALRLARQLTRGSDAEDLVSEAFTKMMDVLTGGGGPDVAFRAYLLTAVRRLYVDRVRRDSRLTNSDDMEAFDPGVPFQDTVVAQFESSAAARAFASLPERWQLVLWHLEVENQKPADIAPLLGMSANSVSALAYRAREGLRQAFLSAHLADTGDAECRWTVEHLGGYVRKGLAKRDNTKVQAHLDSCRSCTAMYLELTEVNSDLRGIIAPLLLGTAAAGYLAGAGAGAGVSALVALLGRARDVLLGSSSTSAGTSAGAAGTTATTTATATATTAGTSAGVAGGAAAGTTAGAAAGAAAGTAAGATAATAAGTTAAATAATTAATTAAGVATGATAVGAGAATAAATAGAAAASAGAAAASAGAVAGTVAGVATGGTVAGVAAGTTAGGLALGGAAAGVTAGVAAAGAATGVTAGVGAAGLAMIAVGTAAATLGISGPQQPAGSALPASLPLVSSSSVVEPGVSTAPAPPVPSVPSVPSVPTGVTEAESQSSSSALLGNSLVIAAATGPSGDDSADQSSDTAGQSEASTAESETQEQSQSGSVDETQVEGDASDSTADPSPATSVPSTEPETSPSEPESPTPSEPESPTASEPESPGPSGTQSPSTQPPISPEVSPQLGAQLLDPSDGLVSVQVDDLTASRYTGLTFHFFVNGAAVKLAEWPPDCTFDGFTAACGTRQDPFSDTFDLELAGVVADGQPLTVTVTVSASGVGDDTAETSDTVTAQPAS